MKLKDIQMFVAQGVSVLMNIAHEKELDVTHHYIGFVLMTLRSNGVKTDENELFQNI